VSRATAASSPRRPAADLRKKLANPVMPFSLVDLAAWVKSGSNYTNLPHTRLALLNATKAPNVTAAMAYDLGDTGTPWPGHPRSKQPIGARLAANLLVTAYGRAGVQATGPTYASSRAAGAPAAGALAVNISFTPASIGRGLRLNATVACPTADGVPAVVCEAFGVQTSDRVWHTSPRAALTADGAGLQLVVTGVASGLTAIATRGMFADWPVASLSNADGFPCTPWLEPVEAA